MNRNLETRVSVLEEKVTDNQPHVPGLIYITGIEGGQTFEEAKAEYKQRHGFDLPEDARVYEIQAYDASKPIHNQIL